MPMKTIHSPAYRALIRGLRERRVELGLNQSQVAARLGHGRTWLQKVEAMDLAIDVIQTVDLLKALHIPLDAALELLQKDAP